MDGDSAPDKGENSEGEEKKNKDAEKSATKSTKKNRMIKNYY